MLTFASALSYTLFVLLQVCALMDEDVSEINVLKPGGIAHAALEDVRRQVHDLETAAGEEVVQELLSEDLDEGEEELEQNEIVVDEDDDDEV